MFVLLSPAKKLHAQVQVGPVHSQPALLGDTTELMTTTRGLAETDLRRLMGISEKLARLNHARFQAMSAQHDADNSSPAALTFAGDVYVGLDAASLGPEDLAFAQDRVGILSGLYGLLRPLDLIQPYRLEMGTRLSNPRGANLYAFWGERIAREINQRTATHTDQTIINLASKEYFKAVSRSTLSAPIITPVFKEIRDGRARIISFFAKKARGRMTRFLIERRLESPAGLRAFDWDRYRYDADSSTEREWVFTRSS